MLKRKQKINYLTIDLEKSKGGLTHLKWVSVMVDTSTVKRYRGALPLLSKLGRCPRSLLDFLIEEMDDKNKVKNDGNLKKRFNRSIDGKYGDVSINKAFAELCDYSLAKKERKRGVYQINPLYFFKGTEAKRQELIRRNLEKPFLKNISKYRKDILTKKSE